MKPRTAARCAALRGDVLCASALRVSVIPKTRRFKSMNKRGRIPTPIHDRFEKFTNKTEDCWLWQGAKDETGYGRIYYNGRRQRTHRIAWELSHGVILNGLKVLHRCDNRACINPGHLFLGSLKDNNTDRATKGRNADFHGDKNPSAKLTPQQVLTSRQRHALGETTASIARAFYVSEGTIRNILKGRTWTTVQEAISE